MYNNINKTQWLGSTAEGRRQERVIELGNKNKRDPLISETVNKLKNKVNRVSHSSGMETQYRLCQWSPRRKGERWAGKVFQEIMAEKFPFLSKPQMR